MFTRARSRTRVWFRGTVEDPVPIPKLPDDVAREIFAHVPTVTDRLALASTCTAFNRASKHARSLPRDGGLDFAGCARGGRKPWTHGYKNERSEGVEKLEYLMLHEGVLDLPEEQFKKLVVSTGCVENGRIRILNDDDGAAGVVGPICVYAIGQSYSCEYAYDKMLPWLRKAAALGSTGASYCLAKAYMNGKGVEKNI